MPAFAHSQLWSALFWIAYIGWALQELLIFRRDLRPVDGVAEDRGSLRVLIAAMVAAIMAAFLLSRVRAAAIPAPLPLIETPALALMLGGMALRAWAVRTLGAFFRVRVTTQADHRLIAAGPYRRLRHPAYTGGLLTIIGVALAMGNWLSLLAPLIAVAGFAHRIAVEERSLAGRFGDAWTAFRARRWALLPPLW